MIASVSWRNIWRNKLRSTVVIMAVTFGLFAGIFSSGVMQGMIDRRIYTGINTELSHIQVHEPRYTENNEPEFTLPSAHSMARTIRTLDGVAGVASRTRIIAMASSAETGTGVMIVGVDPELEPQVTDLHTRLIEGEYLSSGSRNTILIGKKLADKLNIHLRSRIVITLQSSDGHITSGAFRVVGIFKTSNTAWDEMNAFVGQEVINQLAGLADGTSHELAIRLSDNDQTARVSERIKGLYPDLEVRSWYELNKELGLLTEYMDYYLYVFMIIILLALAFGIVNTMLMVVLERVKELGMLMAIGMTRTRVFLMIMLETLFLSFTGALAGTAVSAAVMAHFYKTGLHFEAFTEGFEAYGYEAVAYPYVTPQFYLMLALLVSATAILASIYPALKALRLNPADALRTE
ncbi:MAG: ABC transporter permease [Bacteroidales bacterium]|nr:ABC transporter permease [Bacteroidales bacterium]